VSEAYVLDPARIDDVMFGNANGAGEDNRGGGWGLAAICIGVGQGLAVVLETV
jgi:acetyl-CoA acetyltransferase